ARTVARRSVEELRELKRAGLTRLHMGLESGHDPVLKMVKKGVTAEQCIEAGQKVKAAGIELSEYVMPGLGGRKMWKEHAVETARVLNAVDADFIRLRTLKVLEIMPLQKRVESGELELMSDDEIVEELRLFIENLDGIQSRITSDHILNLLEDVEGKLPEAKEKILAVIDRYLSLPQPERENFRLGRRAGFYRTQEDMNNPDLRSRVDRIMLRIRNESPEDLDQVISGIMESFI
ncbi:MAG: radical SAM protein, partial [Acidobacteria bacterium]|nr:radical SAM protein [Acidobacteriota bacterium]